MLTDVLAFLITDCMHVNAHDGVTLGPKNDEKQAQKRNIFIYYKKEL